MSSVKTNALLFRNQSTNTATLHAGKVPALMHRIEVDTPCKQPY